MRDKKPRFATPGVDSRSSGGKGSRGKLPLLTARPGNVGVQIDAFRTMKLFNRPRCSQFTAKFLGITYENHSMENHARMVERTQSRARLVTERLAKLKLQEATLVKEEERRRERRKQREAADQQHQWLQRQATKKVEQRDREEQAARTLQCVVVQGDITRRRIQARKDEETIDRAATRLQSNLKAYIRKRFSTKQRQARDKERRLHAALTIQRHTRQRLAKACQYVDALRHPAERDEDQLVGVEILGTPVRASMGAALNQETESVVQCEPISVSPIVDLSHELTLELLFPAPTPTDSPTGETPTPTPARQHTATPQHSLTQPCRPMAVKRVGGGFRPIDSESSRLRSSKPPHQQPPGHRQARPTHARAPSGIVADQRRPQEVNRDENEDALLDLVQHLEIASGSPPLELNLDS